jgi:plastocyanin
MALAGLLFWTSAAWAGQVSGLVRTITRTGVAPAPAIVYAEPLDASAPKRAQKFTLTQRDKVFIPAVLPVPVGSAVEFPNEDAIFHNVFSLSGPQAFDLGLYRAGDSRVRSFTSPGVYRVFCNIHPQMTALIVVVPTPFVATAGHDGRFSLDVPAGRYRVTALSSRASPVSAEHTIGAGAGVASELVLDESHWVAAQHLNKHGRAYPRTAYQR